MIQTSFEQEKAQLQRMFQNQLNDLETRLDQRLQPLEAPVFDATSYVAMANLLPNSHPDYSTLAYTTAATSASTVSDANRNAYNWYYQTAAATDLTTTPALLASGHSGFAGLNADAPVWDAVNGTFLLGGSAAKYDVACPLPTDFVFPGQTFYVYFEAAVASTSISIPDSLQFYCGFWDETAGQRKWIEGGDFTPTASVYGAAGSRSLTYKILASTDSGTQILSSSIAVTTAPATMSETNHVRLNFSGAPGFIEYKIYRSDGTTIRLVHTVRNSIDLDFFDMQETAGSVEPAFPTVTTNRPQAYAITAEFSPGSLSSTSFAAHTLTIKVPTTYNRSNTGNGMQWFRFGLDELLTAGQERGIVIRRVSVSEGYGSWARSPLDLQAKSSPTSTATSAPGTGTVTDNPPTGGSGNPTCVTLDTMIEVERGGEIEEIPMGEIQRGDYLTCGATSLPVLKMSRGTVQSIYEITTENGLKLRCTKSHRLIRSRQDRTGVASSRIKEGDAVLTCIDGLFETSQIVKKIEVLGETVVQSIQLPAPHLFLTNKIVSHNRKFNDFEIL